MEPIKFALGPTARECPEVEITIPDEPGAGTVLRTEAMERSRITQEEEKRLRLILILEGCPWEDLNALVDDFRHKPNILRSFLSDWTPVTENSIEATEAIERLRSKQSRPSPR
jgi:hypothetical protein